MARAKPLKWNAFGDCFLNARTIFGTISISHFDNLPGAPVTLDVPWITIARIRAKTVGEAKKRAQILFQRKAEQTVAELFVDE